MGKFKRDGWMALVGVLSGELFQSTEEPYLINLTDS
jgi:hypothetical protein